MTSLNLSNHPLFAKVVTFDVETSTICKGSAFNEQNVLVMMQVKVGNTEPLIFTKENFNDALDLLRTASCVVGTNLKFDLHWLQREFGVKVNCVWDLQIAEFLFSQQKWKYPDLATMCENYGVTKKLDVVKTEYWDKGLCTLDVPYEILAEYGAGDVNSTYEVFLKQVELFEQKYATMFKLFRLQCNDLLVLQEMEHSGIVYDVQASLDESARLDKQLSHLEEKIYAYIGGVPLCLNSRDHISALLYGGTITEDTRVPIGVYKTGAKTGQTRFKIVEKAYELPRLVQPLKGSELKKEGYFGTDESTLLSLKPTASIKKLLTWLLERSKIMKLKATYLEGLPKLIEEQGWKNGILYPNYNQCMAQTGRLSSTRPNSQNLAPVAKSFCITRF